jgi:hypothetical protein
MPIRSPFLAEFSMSREVCTLFGSVRGAGAAIPTITPTALSTTTTIQTYTAEDNFVASTARSGVGTYTLTLKDSFPVILDIEANVWGTDGKRCQVIDYNPTTRVLSVQVYTAAGAAVDLATTDNLKLAIAARLST